MLAMAVAHMARLYSRWISGRWTRSTFSCSLLGTPQGRALRGCARKSRSGSAGLCLRIERNPPEQNKKEA